MQKKKIKIGYLLSHPIQYQTPLIHKLNKIKELDLNVFYFSDYSLKKYFDKEMNKFIKWDLKLTGNYNYNVIDKSNQNYLKFFFSFYKLIKSKNFDFFLIHGYENPKYLISILILKLFKIKILMRNESNNFNFEGNLTKKIFTRVFYFFLNFFIYKFLFIGSKNKEFYIKNKIQSHKLIFCPYTVDNNFFYFNPKKKYTKKKDVIILYTAKLINKKNPEILIKAFINILKKNNNKIKLLIVGDGLLRKNLKKKYSHYKKNIFFLGFQNQKKLRNHYKKADIFVLPSSKEPWGLVVNEAMCFELPIITSNKVCASYDLVKKGYNGYTFKTNSVMDLQKYLIKLIFNKKKREIMGINSRKIISNWNINKTVDGVRSAIFTFND